MNPVKVCPACNAEYPVEERFCPRDGSVLRAPGAESGSLVGSVIGERYHVLRTLGEGGMGQVYLAEHVKMGRKCALKVMHHGMMHDADAISRFNREAANASRISHPNVAAIYDFGETTDGVIYLAMEYIQGEALSAVVHREGALSVQRAARIIRQAGDALTVAHEMGIVHRDLKPDNIMIARGREGLDLVKIVDFGIAKAADVQSQKVTRTGMVVGTPEYMSPEQLSGDPLDGRSDVYSLALVGFNMLTGTLPFPSDSAQRAMIMRLMERPRTLAEMAPQVRWPAEVQAIMDRGLAREAVDRYATAHGFAEALHDALGRMPPESLTLAGTLVIDAPAADTAVPVPIHAAAPGTGSLRPKAAAPDGIGIADLAQIEASLVHFVGPIGAVLVRRTLKTAPTRDVLVAALSRELNDEAERAAFLASCHPVAAKRAGIDHRSSS